MEERFVLKRNSFFVFIISYSLIAIIGSVLGSIIRSPEGILKVISYTIYAVSFIGGLVFAIINLKHNNSVLVVSDKNLNLCEYKKNQLFVRKQFNFENIEKIYADEVESTGVYKMFIKGNSVHKLSISSAIKPDCVTVLKISGVLSKILGDKFEAGENKELKEYLETGKVPLSVRQHNESRNNKILISSIVLAIFSVIPTLLGILSVFWLTLRTLMEILILLRPVFGG